MSVTPTKTVRQVANLGVFQDTTLFASATKTSSGNGSDFETYNMNEATFFLNVSAASGTSPTLDVDIEGKDPVSAGYFKLVSFAQKTAISTGRVVIGLGSVDDANTDAVASVPLPHIIRAKYTIGGTSPSFTFSVGISEKP